MTDWAAFLNYNLSVLSLYDCQTAKLLFHLQKNCAQSVSSGTMSSLIVDFAALSAVLDIALSAVQVQLFLVLCFAKRFPSAVRGRIDSFS